MSERPTLLPLAFACPMTAIEIALRGTIGREDLAKVRDALASNRADCALRRAIEAGANPREAVRAAQKAFLVTSARLRLIDSIIAKLDKLTA